MTSAPILRRRLGLPLLTLYGLGTTVGAGIFVLVGEVAGVVGNAAPLSFLIAAVLAGMTAFSFAELAVRFPVSASEAAYVREGLNAPRLSVVVGLMVVAAASISSAAILNGFVGYLRTFLDLPDSVVIILLALILTAVAAWGILESVSAAALFTLVEVGGLLLILYVAGGNLAHVDRLWTGADSSQAALPILTGAVLAFYAFIGFEDMVNVAEEVKNVRHNMPLAIGLTLAITTVLYVLISTTAVLTLSPTELSTSGAPLAAIYEKATGSDPYLISGIGMIAVINGALIQIIMASRVLYGLSARGMLVKTLSRINPVTRTPLIATLVVGTIVAALALWLPLVTLAKFTSLVTLTIFAIVNLALLQIKRHQSLPDPDRLIPIWVPVLGFAASIGFALLQLYDLMFST